MKRRNRDLVLFNLSALDVLATATGVFVLLAVLMMPYFRKTLEAHAELADVRASVEQLEAEVEGVRRATAEEAAAAAEISVEAQATEAAAAQRRATTKQLKQEAERARSRADQDEQLVAALEQDYDKRIVEALDLVFVIDTTASMRPVIRDLSLSMSGIVRVLQRLVPSLRVAVVAYRDHDTGAGWTVRSLPPTPTSSSMAEVQAFVDWLKRAIRSSRTPREAVYAGLREALSLPLRPGAKQSIIVIGDAAPHRNEERRTLDLARRYVRSGSERSVSALFVDTPAYRLYGTGDRNFFAALARIGGGEFNEHSGGMIEGVLLSVLDTR
jgi:multidrug efflux pump subunit AcrA (membrane-fusion protein)